jgi:hypothetical protein
MRRSSELVELVQVGLQAQGRNTPLTRNRGLRLAEAEHGLGRTLPSPFYARPSLLPYFTIFDSAVVLFWCSTALFLFRAAPVAALRAVLGPGAERFAIRYPHPHVELL